LCRDDDTLRRILYDPNIIPKHMTSNTINRASVIRIAG
jgi:hypothetical protein